MCNEKVYKEIQEQHQKIMKREYRTLLEYIWKPGVNEWIPKKYPLLSYVGNMDGPNTIEES